MLAKVTTATIAGLTAEAVTTEVDISHGQTHFTLVGLPDPSVKEAEERVRSAIRNSDFEYPLGRITVNLAPAELKKTGAWYDLPIALAILAASYQIPAESTEGLLVLGELSLDGDIKPVNGVLSAALYARDAKLRGLIVPAENAAEAACIEGLKVYPVQHLAEAASFLKGNLEIAPQPVTPLSKLLARSSYSVDFSEVRGQEAAKRALEVAAAGMHNVLLMGPPGSGKTMMSQRMPTILPDLSEQEAIEVSTIYSIAGQLPAGKSLVTTRPFRHPHHTISAAGLAGGGTTPGPGEISLAHTGVLFLDETLEFTQKTLELLRQPLEDGEITISRARSAVTFPSRFLLLAATNPCPCGYLGDPLKPCRCTIGDINKYRKRLSGPLLDRIDIVIEVPRVGVEKLRKDAPVGEDSATIRERVMKAWRAQQERYRKRRKVHFNSHLQGKDIDKLCALDEASENLLSRESIKVSHLAEAIQYRAGEERLRYMG
ncbi:MAG: hypothetical protein B1H03_07075 [Planctomycetales bacterium 4484_113]|nr:MAG: hypothetical protein B1H03_07075 [Planctomycetales bacterium 4484_113]